MGLETVIGGALALAGTFIQTSSQMAMVEGQKQASTRAENTRQQQMQLDSQRRRRQSVREALFSRSMSLAVGTSQGAQYGSGVAGGMAGAVSAGMENVQTTNASETLGNRMFDANRDYFNATASGQAGMAFGAGLSSLGGAIMSNAGQINQLGTLFSGGARPKVPKMRPVGAGFGFSYAGNGG
jgi:type II secretory pathway pseudopilin PulG